MQARLEDLPRDACFSPTAFLPLGRPRASRRPPQPIVQVLPGLALPASTPVRRVAGSRRAPTARRLALRPSAAAEAQHGEGPSTSGRGPAPGHSHGYAHHHAPPPLGALPDRRGGAGMRSLHGLHSPVLRSLALSTVAIPRRQLQERYGGAATEPSGHEAGRAAPPRALAAQAQAQALLPGPLRLQGGLAQLDRRAAPAAAPPAEEKPLSAEALTLVLLSTAVAFICSIDRAAMSVAILPMSEQFAWDDGAKGAVSSAFFAGEAGGWLAGVLWLSAACQPVWRCSPGPTDLWLTAAAAAA